MAKLTKEQVKQIKELSAQGLSTYAIARLFNVTQNAIQYWVSSRDKVIKKNVERYRNKTPEEKKKVYEKQKPYYANYFKERYWNDPVFREKHKARCRKNGT